VRYYPLLVIKCDGFKHSKFYSAGLSLLMKMVEMCMNYINHKHTVDLACGIFQNV